MKFILSPARKIISITIDITPTKPLFENETNELLGKLKELSPWELENILRTNEKIAFDAFKHIQDFDSTTDGIPALLAYDGLAYKYLDPQSLKKSAL